MPTLTQVAAEDDARARAGLVIAGVAAISLVHFLLGMESPAAQVTHVILGALYVVPVLGAAWWFGWRPGVLCAVVTSAIHGAHVVSSWPAHPMIDVTQATLMSLLIVVAAVTGSLVEELHAERTKRLEWERRAERAATIGGIATLMNEAATHHPTTRPA